MNLDDLSLAEWKTAVLSLPLRAEEVVDPTETYASTSFVDQLLVPHHQLIYGRRGTGKTHLLRRLEELYRADFHVRRAIPIMVNGSSLRQSAQRVEEDTVEIRALTVYAEFMRRIVSDLHAFVTRELDPSFWDRALGGAVSRQASEATAILADLFKMVREGELRFLPSGDASEEIDTLKEAVAKVEAGARVNLTDPHRLAFALNAGASTGTDRRQSTKTLRVIRGQIVLPFAQLARRLDETLKVLGGASLVILFDEWSDVDRSLETQPYLADMLKRTFSSVTSMYVKLACIPVRTRLSTTVSSDDPISVGPGTGRRYNFGRRPRLDRIPR